MVEVEFSGAVYTLSGREWSGPDPLFVQYLNARVGEVLFTYSAGAWDLAARIAEAVGGRVLTPLPSLVPPTSGLVVY